MNSWLAIIVLLIIEKRIYLQWKKNIIKTAKNKLKNLYGNNIPLIILNHFNFEKITLKDSDCLLWMSFYGKLQENLKAKDIYMEIREPQIPESLIAWLLGDTNTNSLPSHYYCPHCKKNQIFFKCTLWNRFTW